MKPNLVLALDASSIKSLLLIEFHCQEVIFVGVYFGEAISLLLGCHYGVIEKLIKRSEKFPGNFISRRSARVGVERLKLCRNFHANLRSSLCRFIKHVKILVFALTSQKNRIFHLALFAQFMECV